MYLSSIKTRTNVFFFLFVFLKFQISKIGSTFITYRTKRVVFFFFRLIRIIYNFMHQIRVANYNLEAIPLINHVYNNCADTRIKTILIVLTLVNA